MTDIFDTSTIDNFDPPEISAPINLWRESSSNQEAFYTAALSETEDPIGLFQEVKEGLLINGDHDAANTIRESISTKYNQYGENAVFQALQDQTLDLDEKQTIINTHLAIQKDNSDIDLRDEYMIEKAALATEDPNALEEDKRSSSWVFDHIDEITAVEKNIEKTVNAAYENMEVMDIVASMVPLNGTEAIASIGEEILGLDPLRSPGKTIVELRNKLQAAKADPVEYNIVATEIIEAISNNAGFLDNNTAIKADLLRATFSESLGNYSADNIDIDRHIEDLIAILDTMAIGGLAKVGKNLFKLRKGSPISAVNAVNQADAKTLLAAAATDETGRLAKAIGITKEEAVYLTMPKPPIGVSEVLPDGVEKVVQANRIFQNEIAEVAEQFPVMLNPVEKKAGEEAFKKDLSRISDAYYSDSMSTVVATDEGWVAKAVFKLDENTAFPTAKSAMERGKSIYGEATEVDILKRDVNGEIVPANIDDVEGQFFFSIKDERTAAAISPTELLLFGEDNIVPYHRWTVPEFFRAPTAKFIERMTRGTLRADQQGSIIRGNLYKIIDKPFLKLHIDEQKDLISLFSEAGVRGDWHSSEELVTKFTNLGNSPKEVRRKVAGYKAWQTLQDTLYGINNQRLRNSYLADKFNVIKQAEDEYVARVLKEGNTQEVRTVFDPGTKEIIALSKDQIADLYKSNKSIALLKSEEVVGNVRTPYLLVDSALAAIKPIPPVVLRYTPGYSARMYKDPMYVIEKVEAEINGVSTVREVVQHIVPGKKEADSLLADLRARNPDKTYDTRLDRSLISDDRSRYEYELNRIQGRLFFNKRGEHKAGVDGLATIADPVEATIRAISAASQGVSHDGLIRHLKQKYIDAYGHMSEGKFPSNAGMIVSPKGPTPELDAAKKTFDYIQTISGGQKSEIVKWIQEKSLSLANWAESGDTALLRPIAAGARATVDKDPIRGLRAGAFHLFISGNPIRQALLQSQQFMYIAPLAPTYVANPLGFALDVAGIRTGMLIKDNPILWKHFAPSMAKSMGMSIDEYKEYINIFNKTGLVQEISKHTVGADATEQLYIALNKNLAQRGIHKAMAPVRFMKNIGFDWGEYNARVMTYSIARHEWMKKNPGRNWKSTRAQQEIATSTEALVFSMNRADQYSYQKGWLSPMMQFFSIQNKAHALVLPARMGGSKILDEQQKFRLGLGAALNYGVAGLGLTAVYDEVKQRMEWDIPKKYDEVIRGGIQEVVFNTILRSSMGDERTDLSISKTFSPASGAFSSSGNLIMNLANGDKTVLEVFGGPGAVAMGRLGKITNLMYTMSQYHDMSDPANVLEILKTGTKALSGFSNFYKSRTALQIGYYVDSQGDEYSRELYATEAEAWAEMAGIRSHLYDKHFSAPELLKEAKTSAEKDAEYLYDTITMMVDSKNEGDVDDRYYAKFAETAKMIGLLRSMAPKDGGYNHIMAAHLSKLVRQRAGKDGSLVKNLQKMVYGNKIDGSVAKDILRRLENDRQITPRQADDIRSAIEYHFEGLD